MHIFHLPAVTPYQVYSMRKIVPAYTGGIVQIARTSDNALADIYANDQAVITQMVVASPAQTITDLNSIKTWIGATDPDLKKWYDQSGNGLHLVNQGTASKFRLVSDKGDYPAIYITGGGSNYLKVTTANTVSSLAFAVFADFTYRTGAYNAIGGFFSYENIGQNYVAHFIKQESGNPLTVRNIGSGYSTTTMASGNIEGRLSAGFNLAPNDIRVYLGRKVVIYNNAFTSLYTYNTGSDLVVGSCLGNAIPVPGNEYFEVLLYTQSLSHNQMYNLTSNMTYFFDGKGSIPHTNFAPHAVYSVRRVVPTYYGPNLQVKRASDHSIANLYTDAYANYTALDVSGGSNITTVATIKSWMENTVVYVMTIFDQSGGSRDMTACSTNVYPTLIQSSSESNSPYVLF